MTAGQAAQAIALLAVARMALHEAGGSHARGVAEHIDHFVAAVALGGPSPSPPISLQLDGRQIAVTAQEGP